MTQKINPRAIDGTVPTGYGTATELADVDAAAEAAGTSTAVARADHKHSIATAAPVAATGTTQSAGTSTSLARADHQHGVTGLTIAQTTGLQAALDGKAAVGHTHAEPFVKLGKSADQSIPGTTWTAITWDIENNDTLNLHNSTNPSRITVASSGLYRTEVHLSLGIGTSTDYYLRFPKNGVFLSGRSAQYVNATSEHTATFSLEVPLVASDYLEARLYASNGATALADNGDIGSVWIVRRVGPTP